MKSFSDLRFFCKHIVNKYGSPSSASEDEKADEFRNVYLRKLPLNLRTLRAVAAACGIHLNGMDDGKLPQNLRGFHDVFGDRRNIYYKKNDTRSGIENTILHEFREMIEPVFVELCPDYEPLRTIAVHQAANRFATAVLLPKESFREKVYETGMDVVALSKYYYKSCSQVLLRMGEVLYGKLFFYGALYENTEQDKSNWKVTYWTGTSNNDDPDANVYGLDGFFPRKGREVVPGSLVDMTVKEKKPHIAERITLLDEMDEEGLVAIANPLMIQECPAKVVLVALMARNNDLLAPQVERTAPFIVEGFHQHL